MRERLRSIRGIGTGDTDILYEMGCRIRDRRTELGLSMEKVAEAIGYETVKSLSRIERGEMNCTPERLYRLALVLDLSVDYMLFGDGDRKHDTEIRPGGSL